MPVLDIKEELVFQAVTSVANEVSSHTYGWKVVDYTNLRKRTKVGQNRPIPGTPGRLYVPQEFDETIVVLTWKINGKYEADGTPYSDSFDGVDLNHQVILDNIVNLNILRAVAFTDRHDVEFDGSVVVDNWEPSVDPNSGGDALISPMTLKIPGGWLVETGS